MIALAQYELNRDLLLSAEASTVVTAEGQVMDAFTDSCLATLEPSTVRPTWLESLVGRCRQPSFQAREPDRPVSSALPIAFCTWTGWYPAIGVSRGPDAWERLSGELAWRETPSNPRIRILHPLPWRGSLHFLFVIDKPCGDTGLGTGGVEPRSVWTMRHLPAVTRRHPWSARHRSRPRDGNLHGLRWRNCAP